MKTIIDRSLLNVFLCSLFFAMILPKFELAHLFVLCCSQIFAELLYSLFKRRVLLLSMFVIILFSSCNQKEEPTVENLPIDSIHSTNKIYQNTEKFYDISPEAISTVLCFDHYHGDIHYKIFKYGDGLVVKNITLDSLEIVHMKYLLNYGNGR